MGIEVHTVGECSSPTVCSKIITLYVQSVNMYFAWQGGIILKDRIFGIEMSFWCRGRKPPRASKWGQVGPEGFASAERSQPYRGRYITKFTICSSTRPYFGDAILIANPHGAQSYHRHNTRLTSITLSRLQAVKRSPQAPPARWAPCCPSPSHF
jgi:hypothetical protein